MSLLRGMIVTDIHSGPDYKKTIGHKMGSWAPTLVDQFVRLANKKQIDFVGNCGDNLLADDPVLNSFSYIKYHTSLSRQFNRLNMPYGEAQGNHDWATAKYHTAKIGTSPLFPTNPRPTPIDFEHARVIVWNGNANVWAVKMSSTGNKQKDWLKRALDRSDKPTIIISHAPFEWYKDEAQLRDIVENYGNVALSIHGHKHHPDRLEIIGGIPYFTQQSFTEKQPSCLLPWGAYANLTLDKNTITIERKNLMADERKDRIFHIHKTDNKITATIHAPNDPSI